MKTTLSIALIVLFSISGFSQKRAQVNKSMKYYSVQAEMSNPIDGSEIYQGTLAPVKSTNFQSEEDMGETFYDKQSNRAVANRVYLHPDGTMAATWTFSLETSGFNDRGSAYNYYDGNAWGSWPTARVETIRSGWPSYAPLGENGEIIVSHNAVDALVINARPEKGTGSWTETLLQGPAGFDKVTWPRVTTTGTDNSIVHVLGMIRDYPISGDMELAYYRSDDAAVSWEIENYLIPGTSHDDYNDLGADSYTFAEPRAGVIAFFVANIWCDAFIMKSTDDGDSWDKIMVWEHPYPFYDENTIFTDTLWAPDNSGHIALDSEGKAHVVFGLCFVNHAEVGTTYTYYPAYGDGIAYWNEDMDPFENANQHDALDPYDVLEEDVNLIGWSQDLDNSGTIDLLDPVIAYSEIGLSTMPNIIVDETNRIFVAWASTTESFDNGVNNYKHIWARASHSTDIGWGSFLDITGGLIHIFDECVYPQFAPLSDDNVYLMYNYDQNPGNAVDGDHDYVQNKQSFVTLGKDEILGVGPMFEEIPAAVSQNYPNPFSGSSLVKVDLKTTANLHLEVYNVVGQKVYETPNKKANAGSQYLTIDGSSLIPGVYTYTVFINEHQVSKKLVIE